jgi:hypothetical protein
VQHGRDMALRRERHEDHGGQLDGSLGFHAVDVLLWLWYESAGCPIANGCGMCGIYTGPVFTDGFADTIPCWMPLSLPIFV